MATEFGTLVAGPKMSKYVSPPPSPEIAGAGPSYVRPQTQDGPRIVSF